MIDKAAQREGHMIICNINNMRELIDALIKLKMKIKTLLTNTSTIRELRKVKDDDGNFIFYEEAGRSVIRGRVNGAQMTFSTFDEIKSALNILDNGQEISIWIDEGDHGMAILGIKCNIDESLLDGEVYVIPEEERVTVTGKRYPIEPAIGIKTKGTTIHE